MFIRLLLLSLLIGCSHVDLEKEKMNAWIEGCLITVATISPQANVSPQLVFHCAQLYQRTQEAVKEYEEGKAQFPMMFQPQLQKQNFNYKKDKNLMI